jgi:NADH-quinone oxidoreductase subunit E
MRKVIPETPEPSEKAILDEIISKHIGEPGALLGILEAVQDRNPHHFLPKKTLSYIASKTGVPYARIQSVATFYALFNLEPQGENTVCICRGTACHTRGSRALLECIRLELGLVADESREIDQADKLTLTTSDGKFTLRTVACFGQCALAPVVELNHRICGHVNERTLHREIRGLGREGE